MSKISTLDLRGSVILRLMRQRSGSRRKVIKVRPIKPKLNEKRALRAIINEIVAAVFAHKAELLAAAHTGQWTPLLHTMDGEPIGIFKDTADDIDRLMQLIVTQSQNVMVRIQARVLGWSRNVADRHEKDFVHGILTATKVDVSTQLHPTVAARTAGHYVTWSTSLIRDVGDEARKRIGSAVLQAVRERTPPALLAKSIQEIEAMSYRRAKNIAADQTTKLNAALDRARQEEVGITAFTWVHSGSPHPREEHLDRDGEVFDWDTNDIEAGDFPGEPPFCGCSAQATIINEAGQEIDTGDIPVEEA